jgi:hypothetical protein
MPPEVVEVRSHEAGAYLAITGDTTNQPDAHDLQDCYWLATLTCGQLHASLRFYELRIAGLRDYFGELARNWRGWQGELRWTSLEHDLTLLATHDGSGTISLKVRLRPELSALHHWTASAELLLDAAGLERLARDAQALR